MEGRDAFQLAVAAVFSISEHETMHPASFDHNIIFKVLRALGFGYIERKFFSKPIKLYKFWVYKISLRCDTQKRVESHHFEVVFPIDLGILER